MFLGRYDSLTFILLVTYPKMLNQNYFIELLKGNVLKVRIPSKPFQGVPIPDAVFTFRMGDPQYEIWIRRYSEQQKNLQNAPNEKMVG